MKKVPLRQLLLFLLLFGFAFEVVVLSAHTRRQKQALLQLVEDRGLGEGRRPLAVGDAVPALRLASPEGPEQVLRFGAGEPKRLLLVFNTRCPACAESVEGWNRLARASGAGFQVLAVTEDPADAILDYARRMGLDYPAFRLLESTYREALLVSFVPHSILLDSAGTVLGVWPGPLREEQLRYIEAAAGASSPTRLAREDCACGAGETRL
jgi:peroxiredoxin